MALTEVPIELSSTPGIIDNSTGTAITIDSSNNTNFADNAKAIFGAGSDLQIYHDGSNNRIVDSGTGSLYIQGQQAIILANADATEFYATFDVNGASTLRYDNSQKLATTATGIDVTGTVTADGLSVAGLISTTASQSTDGQIRISNSTTRAAGNKYGIRFADSSFETNASIYTEQGGSGNNAAALIFGTSGGTGGIGLTSATARMRVGAGGDISFYEDTGTTAKFFWDASAESLGIGIAPQSFAKLQVNTATDRNVSIFDNAAGATICGITDAGASTSLRLAGSNLIFTGNGGSGAEAMRIDTSGNVGIGTSTITSGFKLEVTGDARFGDAVGDDAVEIGWSSGGSEGFIQAYDRGASAFRPLSINNSLNVDASGRVGIGNSSPSNYTGAGARTLVVGSNSSAPDPYGITIVGGSSSTSNLAFTDNAGDGSANDYRGLFQYHHPDDSLRVFVASTERMRIDASGNLLVGDTSTVPFDGTSGVLIGGARTSLAFATTGHTHKMLYSVNTGTAGLHFYDSTNNRTDMIWDNSGNLLVGVTSISDATSRAYGNAFSGTSANPNWKSWGEGTHTNAQFRNATNVVGSIVTTSTTTTYNTSSDQRLKENIVDAPSASDDIDAIQVRSFDWKVDGSHQKYGMVAQELQTVAPEAVSAPEDPEEMMGVDYSKLVPMMLKEIQSLRARVAQLES